MIISMLRVTNVPSLVSGLLLLSLTCKPCQPANLVEISPQDSKAEATKRRDWARIYCLRYDNEFGSRYWDQRTEHGHITNHMNK